MKVALVILVLLVPGICQAQVVFRNDIIIGKHKKNRGISFIMINLGRGQNLNMLVNGRGGQALVIDVQAIRNPKRSYTYTELAERIYTPGPTYRPSMEPVPRYLLIEPPQIRPWSYDHRGELILPRSRFSLEQ